MRERQRTSKDGEGDWEKLCSNPSLHNGSGHRDGVREVGLELRLTGGGGKEVKMVVPQPGQEKVERSVPYFAVTLLQEREGRLGWCSPAPPFPILRPGGDSGEIKQHNG